MQRMDSPEHTKKHPSGWLFHPNGSIHLQELHAIDDRAACKALGIFLSQYLRCTFCRTGIGKQTKHRRAAAGHSGMQSAKLLKLLQRLADQRSSRHRRYLQHIAHAGDQLIDFPALHGLYRP